MSTRPVEVSRESELRSAVGSLRKVRREAICHALTKLDPRLQDATRSQLPELVEYALLHHTLFDVRSAAAANDHAWAKDAVGIWHDDSTEWPGLKELSGIPVLVLATAVSRPTNDPRFDSTCYTATVPALRTPAPLPDSLLKEALALVVQSGFASVLSDALGVLSIIQLRTEADSITESYSLVGFPGTVFTDWVDIAARLGEFILHEASHSQLNEWLAAEREDLPAEPKAYSPWKRTDRPAYGILHACFAFSTLATYFSHLEHNLTLSPSLRKYCAQRVSIELALLEHVEPSLKMMLEVVQSARIRACVSARFDEALGRRIGT